MILVIAAVFTVFGGLILLVGTLIFRHEQRPLKIGSEAVEETHIQHASWDAVVDNYVYIHNAFRNHLTYIRMKCENTKNRENHRFRNHLTYIRMKSENTKKGDNYKKACTEFKEWKKILDLHSKVEDEIFIPALLARLQEDEVKRIPQGILTGKDHEVVKALIDNLLNSLEGEEQGNNADLLEGEKQGNNADLIASKLKELESKLDKHLLSEEKNIMPLMLEKFTTRELWALDSFIVNEKLGYCDKDMLMKITKWWFTHISVKEGWPLFKNFIQAGKQPEMPIEEWKKLQDTIPALQKYATEDLAAS
mmetsp:Transcript_16353/g.21631  ORF Transcript_16353/g.21631 Transcript_16353/m.21631 type:complete len:307 (+) Transcript_16353:85-1005(+)|eukprot:CAMPEP_0117758632 /NCGR_PEP_ID=MMETSP0947-20121206/15503_1 /TAXON_ID=44440 /ORGANISM="Chattonella subsalsa, Strain CCMP2191" /LENGTH=306 /DNA_ID=CAMNT_0005578875 /DNA_START=77 /DNA_END=997 /DNA_ORIENTATION=-